VVSGLNMINNHILNVEILWFVLGMVELLSHFGISGECKNVANRRAHFVPGGFLWLFAA
jgi:hypothetical protein